MKTLILMLKGVAMGGVDTIPGVSSSTLAVIFGIYEQLTATIGRFISDLKNKSAFRKNMAFLVPIFGGAVLGILIFSGIIGQMVTRYPQATQLFFIGLILGSLPLIATHAALGKPNLSKLAGLALGATVMIFFIIASNKSGHQGGYGLASAGLKNITTEYAIRLFLVGFVCAATMVIPGVSGSMLMVLLGEYYNIIGYVNALSAHILGKTTMIPLSQALLALSITAIGILCGVVVAARFINWALHRARSFTFSTIFAMMALSIIVIWPGIGQSTDLFITNVVSLLVGIVIAFMLSMVGKKIKR